MLRYAVLALWMVAACSGGGGNEGSSDREAASAAKVEMPKTPEASSAARPGPAGAETAAGPAAAASEASGNRASNDSAALISRGKRVFLRCRACHAVAAGKPHKVGPNLHGFYGERAASRPGFSYSQALAAKGHRWTDDELAGFLENPSQWVPGTTMAFAGLSNPADRAAVIAYLKDAAAAEGPASKFAPAP